jgi:methyl-accepting chemotaxis protein
MIGLTIGCSILVMLTGVFLYTRDVDDAISIRLNSSSNIVEYEIAEIKEQTTFTVAAMARNLDLIDALAGFDTSNGFRAENGSERVAYIANSLKDLTQVDFCIIIDKNGNVISRTHDPGRFGDSALELPNVAAAFAEAPLQANLSYGVSPVIRLAVSASAPVYDTDENIIGVITLGTRFDAPEFVEKLSNLTECEVTIFLGNERIATTIESGGGAFAVGTRADEHISSVVLAGGTYRGSSGILGREVYTIYSPLNDRSGRTIGMIAIDFYTDEAVDRAFFSGTVGI